MVQKSLVGYEAEAILINAKGEAVPMADTLLGSASLRAKASFQKECSQEILEVTGRPYRKVGTALGDLFTSLEHATHLARKRDLLLLPLGTYPGKFSPHMRRDVTRYQIKERILGKKSFEAEGRCLGFHAHYTLPKGIFDEHLRMLRMIVRSKVKESMVNSYNFLIAADPAFTTFLQSSPFYQGEHIGKDSRMIVYRGSPALGYSEGVYSAHQDFGALPNYKSTVFDLIDIIKERYEGWANLIKTMGMNVKMLSLYGSVLDTGWNPLRINAHGTIEQRGTDMNHPQYLASAAVLMKYILRKLQSEHYAIVPSEIAIREPFRREGDVIYIPPFPYVRDVLQRESAYRGLQSEVMHSYAKRFLGFAHWCVPAHRRAYLRPLVEMVRKRRTVSDEIIAHAIERGWHFERPLPKSIACEIALTHAERFSRELSETQKLIARLE